MTGMDPVARRFMWEVIFSMTAAGTSVILTTHSMEECEALCSRVGIMVDGALQCLGSVQHLKSRFGRGLMLEARVTPPAPRDVAKSTAGVDGTDRELRSLQDIRELVQALASDGDPAMTTHCDLAARRMRTIAERSDAAWTVTHCLDIDGHVPAKTLVEWWLLEDRADALATFLRELSPDAVLVERNETLFRFRLPGSAACGLAKIFSAVEEQRKQLGISEYSVSQCSLEQVFNTFAAIGSEDHGKSRGMRGQSFSSGCSASTTSRVSDRTEACI